MRISWLLKKNRKAAIIRLAGATEVLKRSSRHWWGSLAAAGEDREDGLMIRSFTG
jgi:hypothetical protein